MRGLKVDIEKFRKQFRFADLQTFISRANLNMVGPTITYYTLLSLVPVLMSIGAIAGLVGITPACGYVGVGGALLVGLVSGLAGLWGVTALKRVLRVDDPCDVFGVHGVCGIVGCIMTGIFAAKSLGGVGYAEGVTMVHQVLVQLESIAITVVWSAVVAFIGYKLADMTVGLRVPEEQEREGLDVNSHGENAYNA